MILALLLSALTTAQTIDINHYDCLKWRMIGPHRGGRTVGATGVPGKPNLFYVGVNNGGVWKSSDAGRTWKPIFDDQPTGSIGALAVAPSNPNVIYVGTGEGLQRPDLSTGDGMFKSMDGGKTWKYLGLPDAQQIAAIIVDPKDENRLFVAVLGHPYGPNVERGVFRSTDGGATWEKVLYKDENTGAVALAFDPTDPQLLYADLWSARQGPWENGSWQGPGSGLFKSTDGGTNWTQLTQGLPTVEQGLGRIGFAVAPSNRDRLYALVEAPQGGVFRSDNQGESWERVATEQRLWGRGSDFAEIKVDPKDPDKVYIGNTAAYRSTDAGKTWTCFRGAPGGDDYHTIWISPENSDIILLAADQGAIITVNGGETWSSWYNQPTAQFYHVITDDQFPYWVYGGQQESGSAAVCSRGNDGQITFREWHPVGVEEYGYVAPDPLNSNIVYGGKVTRYDRTTGQTQDVSPEVSRSGKYRFLRTAPLVFSPVDKRSLFLGGNVLFRTLNGGHSWSVISPDLSREKPDVPESIGVFRTPELATMTRRGVIYSVAPSYVNRNVIWAGTDDGLVHVTRSGGTTWTNVTPSDLTSWSKVAQIDSGRFDSETAYVAVNRIRLDDQKPYLYRTHDGGATWTKIVTGLPDNAPANTIREDSVRRGLLYCGTERAVFFSLDDGDHWQPLRLNMPATSIRDLVVHGDDVVVGTHGRSFWILDNMTPLRQLDSIGSSALLFAPQKAIRVRWNMNTDTPLPPEEPGGQNPPDGAMLDYWLPADATHVTLEILDDKGDVVRKYDSEDPAPPVNLQALPYPEYWIRPFQPLAKTAGAHRFLWDMRYPAAEIGQGFFPMTAILGYTPRMPVGPWVMPGKYRVRLTVDGAVFGQPMTLIMDPRVKTPVQDLRRQFEISLVCLEALRKPGISPQLRRELQALMGTVQEADVAPTAAAEALFAKVKADLAAAGK